MKQLNVKEHLANIENDGSSQLVKQNSTLSIGINHTALEQSQTTVKKKGIKSKKEQHQETVYNAFLFERFS